MSVKLASIVWRPLRLHTAYLSRSATLRSSSHTLRTNVRRYSVPTTPPTKPYYITSPIFYVNAAPHIGHLYTLILTDVFKRWAVLNDRRAILCTGTDEHGMKIQQAAAKAGMDVRAFCDQNCKPFEDLAGAIGVDNDHFIRTSEPEHRFAVQHFWLMLRERGYIYASKHTGWYSVSDETFYPASQVGPTLNQATGRKFMASLETGKEVEWTEESNYHFKLSAMRDKLLDFYKQNPKFVVPAARMADVVQAVESGLQDLSVSRPVERLSWGIPVPDDTTQTIYVWLDALINYLTKANYPFQIPGQEDAAGWPADVQVIGKDIVRFHCIYWPAFLLALDIPPPKQILSHAHWTLGNQKMSKSVGNVVNPFFAIDRFGVDGLRYYMVYNGGIQDDASYENSFIYSCYKKQLMGGLGNLTSRITRGKGWDIRRAVEKATSGAAPASGELAEEHRRLLMDLPGKVALRFEELDAGAALKEVANGIAKTNAYLQTAAPWDLVKEQGKEDELDQIIYLFAESLRIFGILLQPFMPQTIQKQLDLIGVDTNARSFTNTFFGSDANYGTPSKPPGKGLEGVLFPPLIEQRYLRDL